MRYTQVTTDKTALALGLRYQKPIGFWEGNVADLILIGVTIGFFYLAWLYVCGCDRL
ncbi:MAG: hypothetical protein ACM3SP_17380 [Chloroflexota bacterium]